MSAGHTGGRRRPDGPAGGAFHLDDQVLRSYTEDRLADADAWSVEAHLDRCAACRARLTPDAASAEIIAAVAAEWQRGLPPQGRPRRGTASRRRLLMMTAGPAARAAWLGSVALTVAMSLAFAAGQLPIRSWLLLLIAPVLPVLGTAASYGRHTDPLHELVESTPFSGLRIVLWRTLSMLVVCVPVAFGAGLAADLGEPVMWLLPCAALTGVSLCLGSVMDPARAAAAVVTAWAMLVVGTADDAAAGHATVIASATGPAWLAVTVAAAGLMFVRRAHLAEGVSG